MIRLRQSATAVHRRLLQLSDEGQLVRNELAGVDSPDDVQRVGASITSWFKDAAAAGPELLQDGSHLLGLRQEFSRHDRADLLGRMPERVESIKALERSSRYDKRQLEDAARELRRQGLQQIDALLSALRDVVAEVESVMPQGTAAQPRVFFSWQSDSPNNTNRSFIERALELAINDLAAELSIDAAPRLDDAATDLTGAEDIAATILRKIDDAAVFVGDLSIIGHATPRRPTPNPNVLVEVGYALKSLGPGRVILVFNEASGRIEDLPFDLRPRLTMKYRAPETEAGVQDETRATERKRLAKQLAGAIKGILDRQRPVNAVEEAPPRPMPVDIVVEGIVTKAQDCRARASDYMTWLANEIARHLPQDDAARGDDALITAIQETTPLVADFGRVCQTIARHGSDVAATAMARGFEGILQLYDQLPGKTGSFRDTDFDLAKILGHELFVMLVGALLRSESFTTISEVLDADLCVETRQGKATRSWVDLSKHAKLLQIRKQRLQINLYSLHAEQLKLRHDDAVVAEVSPFKAFMEADYFLYLAAALHPVAPPFGPEGGKWKPWSLAYMRWVEADFLARAQRRGYAQKLLPVLKLSAVEQLRERYRERGLEFAKVFDQWGMSVEGGMDSALIASKP